ncbi:MAG: gas vesicle protein GvpG [Flammeovirgaceae bacterium]
MFILDNIFKASAKGIFKVLETIHDRAYDEIYNPDTIKEALMLLQYKLEEGEITEEEYEQEEEILLDRLDEIQANQ